jgi:hypothetical protein
MRPKAARPYILAADEPQPVDPLLIRQADGLGAVVHIAPKGTKPKKPSLLAAWART